MAKKKKANTSHKKTSAQADLAELEAQLAKILSKPKAMKQCMTFFAELDETDRRKLGPFCRKHTKQTSRMIEDKPNSWRANPLEPIANVALFWTVNATEVKKMKHWNSPESKHILEILTARKPDWIEAYVAQILNHKYGFFQWSLARELIRAGLCKKPSSEQYYMGMLNGLGGIDHTRKKSILTLLREDPELLEDEVWRIFEYEGDTYGAIGNADSAPKSDWTGALLKLAKSGELSRQRLLDSSLSALGLGFNRNRAKWYYEFFDRLKPNSEEQIERFDVFLSLLASPAPNVTKWALDKVETLLAKTTSHDAVVIINAAEPLLSAREKGGVFKAIRFIQQQAKTDSTATTHAALVISEALRHERADVQLKALEAIQELTPGSLPDDLRESVERYLPIVAASVRKKIQAWLKTSQESTSPGIVTEPVELQFDVESLNEFDSEHRAHLKMDELISSIGLATAAIPAVTFNGTDIPRLDPQRRLEPIVDLPELIETAARVIEDPLLVDDGERVIDGIARLCDQRPDNFESLTGPLLKRAIQLMDRDRAPFGGDGISADLCGLIYVWIRGSEITSEHVTREKFYGDHFAYHGFEELTSLPTSGTDPSIRRFLANRTLAIIQKISKQTPQTLLSTPTHEGGWIAAQELVRRINETTQPTDELDLILAMLRLAPYDRQAALKQLKAKGVVKGERLSALKYALGAKRITIGKTAALWVAAARARTPLEDDNRIAKAFPRLGPGCGMVAEYRTKFGSRVYIDPHTNRRHIFRDMAIETTGKVPKKLAENIPTQLLALAADFGSTSGGIAWGATVWPQARESYFAEGASAIGSNLDWWDASWFHRTFLYPLLDSDTPLGRMGMLLLLVGLAAKEPGEHGLATDAAIQAINDGRLGTDNFGASLAEYLPSEFFNPTRLAKRFTDLASVSELHAYVVLRALEQGIQGAADNQPRGIGDLLELENELATQLGLSIANDQHLKLLREFKGASKSSKAARSLLSLNADPNATVPIEQAIVARKERLVAWRDRI